MSDVDVVVERPLGPDSEQGGAPLTLPAKDDDRTAQERDPRVMLVEKPMITTPVLAFTLLAATVGLVLAGLQVTRAMNGEDRIGFVSWIEIAAGVMTAIGTVAWTWLVVENARRLLAAAVSQNPLSPRDAAMSWLTPAAIAAAAIGTVAYLERRLNEPGAEVTSPIPLAVACGTLIGILFVSYRPLFLLSSMMRRLGSGSGELARWVWVPVSLAIVGAFTLFGLRSGGAYGEDFDGVAPAWAIGIVFVPPVAIVLVLAWRGGRLVEDAVSRAYDRRNGVVSVTVGRGVTGAFARALRADARPPIARDVRSRVRLVPGISIVRLALMIAIAGLALISIVGALVMFLFWREAADGALLPAQRERAWTALDGLQSFERTLALGATVVASIWAFVTVLNARIASGRRRNPVLAAAAWPGAAYAIWWIADRYQDTEQIAPLVLRFGLQAAAMYVPFFLLERAAISVGARRSPLRLAYALGVVLLVHIQGLGGLATLVEETDIDRFGRIAGYLALAALLELIATVAITESSRVIGDGAASIADKHNFLAEQRAGIEERAAAMRAPGPTVDFGDDDEGRQRTSAAPGDLVVGHDAASVDDRIPTPSRADSAAVVADAARPADEVVTPEPAVVATPDTLAASVVSTPVVDQVAHVADVPAAPAAMTPAIDEVVHAEAVPADVAPPAVAAPAPVAMPTPASVEPATVEPATVEPAATVAPAAPVADPASAPERPAAPSLSLSLSLTPETPAPAVAQPSATSSSLLADSASSLESRPTPTVPTPPTSTPTPSETLSALGDVPEVESFSIPKFVHQSVVKDSSSGAGADELASTDH